MEQPEKPEGMEAAILNPHHRPARFIQWVNLATCVKYQQEVRKLIYTTNASVFPTEDSLLIMLYLATMDITKKWAGRPTYSQLEIFFANRIPE